MLSKQKGEERKEQRTHLRSVTLWTNRVFCISLAVALAVTTLAVGTWTGYATSYSTLLWLPKPPSSRKCSPSLRLHPSKRWSHKRNLESKGDWSVENRSESEMELLGESLARDLGC